MNWLIFAITTYVFLIFGIAGHTLLAAGDVHPQFTLILLVFVGLSAPSRVLAWAAVILGILMDLQSGLITPPMLGPNAIAYLAGAYVIIQLRNMVFRESVIAFAALVFVTGIAVHLVAIAIYTVRGLPWPLAQPLPQWSATGQLVTSFFSLLYTTALALPLGWLLMRCSSFWGFPGKSRQGPRF